MPNGFSTIKSAALQTVMDSCSRVTPLELENRLLAHHPFCRREIKRCVRELVSAGELTYTYHFGCSFLERSFNRPVRISRRIVLLPFGTTYMGKSDDVLVHLRSGAAFGLGDHPTTRLALRAIDDVMIEKKLLFQESPVHVLDIGTGTGVLGIAALKLGADHAVCMDIDPCAIAEAKTNARINSLSHRIRIDSGTLKNIVERFHLIIANLRYPTLMSLYPDAERLLHDGGLVVLSGFKDIEQDDIENRYIRGGFKTWRFDLEKTWACIVFIQREFRGSRGPGFK